MENTQEQKTPEQWFQQLKEPYRGEAIANIDKNYHAYEENPYSVTDALSCSFSWEKSPQGNSYWGVIHNSIIRGETTYLEPETLTPEQMELRPEDLVIGEVYTYINIANEKSILKFSGELNDEEVYYHVKINERGVRKSNDWVSTYGKFYHAIPEEKALLLGEEQTDWEAKYNELKVKYDDLKQAATESNIELNEKIRELETKQQGKKVYFYHDGISWSYSKSLDDILVASREDYEIYEAVCIGKKKSVLVSE